MNDSTEMSENGAGPETSRLESEKLRLEVQALTTKSRLDEQKMQLEIDELRRWKLKLVTGVATALISVLMAVIGWTIQRQRELQQAQFNTTVHRDEVYARILQDFASSSPTQRIGAAVALSEFSRPGADTASESITVMANRLLVEEDQAVLDQIVSVLRGAGVPAVHLVADANRRAGSLFGAAVGRYVGLLVKRRFPTADQEDWFGTAHLLSSHRHELDQPVQNLKREALQTLQEHLEDSVPSPYRPVVGWPLNEQIDPVSSLDAAALVEMFGIAPEFRRHGAGITNSTNKTTKGVADAEIKEALLEVEKSARFIGWTSTGLVELLTANSGQIRGENLDGVVLLGANLRGVDLHGVSFRGAYLAANASRANLSYCDFSQATFAVMILEDTNLTAATLTETKADASTLLFGKPRLTGANWWDASIIDDPHLLPSKAEAQSMLERIFPRIVETKTRNELLKGSTVH